jgi:hypothetical protein
LPFNAIYAMQVSIATIRTVFIFFKDFNSL